MQLQANAWKQGTEDFVSHRVLKEYIQDTVAKTGIDSLIRYNTRVKHVEKRGKTWNVLAAELLQTEKGVEIIESNQVSSFVPCPLQ